MQGGARMRKIGKWLMLLAAALLACGVWHGMRSGPSPVTKPSSSAGMGLVLQGDEKGLYVLAVSENSAAEAAGIVPGDYLLRLGGAELTDAGQMDELLGASAGPHELMLLRSGEEIPLTLP